MKIFYYFIISFALITACEDPIDIALADDLNFIVIDAWVENINEAQSIRISRSQGYFDSSEVETLSNAEVYISNLNTNENFHFAPSGDGLYTYIPNGQMPFGNVGDRFELNITVNGLELNSSSTLHRVPPIDSIVQFERKDELGFTDGKYAKFFAEDPLGLGDVYWIKAYKNDTVLLQPFEINLAYDAAFDAGGEVDGIPFILPIREAIYPIDNVDNSENEESPYATGDEVRVEIISLNLESFLFMETVVDQLQNSSNGIFANPIVNAKGNITSQSGDEILGIFNMGSISRASMIFE